MRFILSSYWFCSITLALTRHKVKERLTLTGGKVNVEGALARGSPPIHYKGQPQPHCSVSYSQSGSYKTIWFIVNDEKVHALAWRCPSNEQRGDISNVDAVDVPPGEYKSDFDKCKAGVQKYVTRYPGTKFNSNAKNLVKAICMNR